MESTAEPTVAGIGSTAVIGIIAAIAISILGFVSYRFYNSKKSKNKLKSNPKQQSPEETKQEGYHCIDLQLGGPTWASSQVSKHSLLITSALL